MSRPPVVETPRSPGRERDRRISRRTLLSLAGAAAAGSAGFLVLRRGRETLHPWERDTLDRLRRRFDIAGDPRVLGPASLEALGDESPGELAEHLFRRPGRFRGRDGESALAAFQDQIRDDYAMGRTLSVADWEVSQTEARLFALLHAMDRPSDRSRS